MVETVGPIFPELAEMVSDCETASGLSTFPHDEKVVINKIAHIYTESRNGLILVTISLNSLYSKKRMVSFIFNPLLMN